MSLQERAAKEIMNGNVLHFSEDIIRNTHAKFPELTEKDISAVFNAHFKQMKQDTNLIECLSIDTPLGCIYMKIPHMQYEVDRLFYYMEQDTLTTVARRRLRRLKARISLIRCYSDFLMYADGDNRRTRTRLHEISKIGYAGKHTYKDVEDFQTNHKMHKDEQD